jgi:hypothetical protein
MFEATFALGQYPMDWINSGVNLLSDLEDNHERRSAEGFD